MAPSITGIVLAGGAGTRMGRPKAEVVLGGVTLVERAVALVGARCAPVVVVTRAEVDLPRLGAAIVAWDPPGPAGGPLPALAAGLATAPGRWALLVACDLPLAGPALDALLRSGAPAVAVDDDGRVQPLCALVEVAAARVAVAALLAAGERRAVALVEVLAAVPVVAPPGSLVGCNTPEQLAVLSAMLSSS